MLNEIKSDKHIKIVLLIILSVIGTCVKNLQAQGIGELAPPKPLEVFPANAWGADIMFGDAGFGLGTFYRKHIDVNWSLFADLSFSETKDEREFEYIDYWGNVVTVGKKNRVFQIPVNFGAHYRRSGDDHRRSRIGKNKSTHVSDRPFDGKRCRSVQHTGTDLYQ